MFKNVFSGFFAGLALAAVIFLGGMSVFGAPGGIKTAAFNTGSISYNGVPLDLGEDYMLSVVREGAQSTEMYMPMRSVLEQMGFVVLWNSEQNAVMISDYY